MNSTDVEAERAKSELSRRILAAAVAAVCVISTGIFLWISFTQVELASSLILQVLASFSLATVVVLGTRAIDGPVRVRSRRRGDEPPSDAASAVRVWISCFVVIEAAFFLAVLAGELDAFARRAARADKGSPQPAKEAPAGVKLNANASVEISPSPIRAGVRATAVEGYK